MSNKSKLKSMIDVLCHQTTYYSTTMKCISQPAKHSYSDKHFTAKILLQNKTQFDI